MNSAALRVSLPWLLLVGGLALPPVISSQSWLFAYLSQTATMIVFALSFNLLLGETGLLSFGHAVYAGLGAFVAAHVFNHFTVVPLWLLPMVGGVAAALAGVVFGFISTRRAGITFAMITLGIGEMVTAGVSVLPQWFGGEAGVSIDRGSRSPFFSSVSHAYVLIAVWCVLACAAMFMFTRTPFARIANAVRDNPVRAASIGFAPRRVQYVVVIIAAFFAGVAGAMGLINVELASAEGVGLARSANVLIAVVIGGTSGFFGPVVGAVLLTFFSVLVANVSVAWVAYLGLFFVWVVVVAPDGFVRFLNLSIRNGWRVCSLIAWIVAIVPGTEMLYAIQFDPHGDSLAHVFGFMLDGRTLTPWTAVIACSALAFYLSRRARTER